MRGSITEQLRAGPERRESRRRPRYLAWHLASMAWNFGSAPYREILSGDFVSICEPERGPVRIYGAVDSPRAGTVHLIFDTGSGFSEVEREVLRKVLTQLANALRKPGQIDERECFIDATFASAKGGGCR